MKDTCVTSSNVIRNAIVSNGRYIPNIVVPG